MAGSQEPGTIAKAAEQCLLAFQQCLQSAASVHPGELSLVEDQLARSESDINRKPRVGTTALETITISRRVEPEKNATKEDKSLDSSYEA